MNKVFYIFRHGETDWNKEHRCQGHTNTTLNENGVSQAMNLAEKMSKYPLEAVFSSDLERAFKTGSMVAEKLNIPIFKDSRLREMCNGKAEGMLFEEARVHFGEELWQRFICFKNENNEVGFPEGETRKEVRERFLNALEEIIQFKDYFHVGISTHGGALRNVLHSFLPEDHPTIAIPNCVVYRLEYQAETKSFQLEIKPLE